MVRRYGQIIGRARSGGSRAATCTTHNLGFEELHFDYEFPSVGETPLPVRRAHAPTFLGYAREDGSVGTRNYIAVVAASNCAAHTAELIARSFDGETLPANVDGVVAFPHGEGCGHAIGPDTEQLQRTLARRAGASQRLGRGDPGPGLRGEPDRSLSRPQRAAHQPPGGDDPASERRHARRQSRRRARRSPGFMEQCAAEQRVEVPASHIVLGLNCGGSDSFSGITANPALGVCSDMLAAIGATAVLAETTEIFGAEHLLVRRARNRQVAEKLLRLRRGLQAISDALRGQLR